MFPYFAYIIITSNVDSSKRNDTDHLFRRNEQLDLELRKNLNELIGSLMVLYMKLHHFHWFVTGPHFFTLHEKFEELYDEVTEYIDVVAERLLQLKERPISTLKECLEHSLLQESSVIQSDKNMVTELLHDLTVLDRHLYEGMELAQNNSDEVTNDILIGMSTSFEKYIWMYRAYLEK